MSAVRLLPPEPPAAAWRLDGVLTIYAAAEAHAALCAALAGTPADQPLVLDASRLDEVDSAGVQLLMSAARSLRERGTPLRLENLAPALQAAAAALGACLPGECCGWPLATADACESA
jgi:anti-sigma B factor antagonist